MGCLSVHHCCHSFQIADNNWVGLTELKASLKLKCTRQIVSTLPYVFLILVYVVIYHDVVLFPHLVIGTDFQIPSTVPLLPWSSFYSAWSPFGLGAPFGISSPWGGAFSGLISLLGGGDVVLTQKFLLLNTLVASALMFVLLRRHVTSSVPIALAGSIIYAYGPPTTWNYGTGIVWEYAFLPAVMYFIVNIIKGEARIRDSALLSLCLSLEIGYGGHYLLLLPLLTAALALPFLYLSRSKLQHLVKFGKYLALAVILTLATNLNLVVIISRSLQVGTSLPGIAQIQPTRSLQYFFSVYSQVRPFDFLTLSNWLTLSYAPLLGYVFAALLLLSPAISARNVRPLAVGVAIAALMIFASFFMIRFKTMIFVQLFAIFPPLAILSDEFMMQYLVWLLVATAVTITISGFTSRSYSKANSLLRSRENGPVFDEFVRNLARFAKPALLVALVLIAFLYEPAFNPSAQIYSSYSSGAGPIENPPVYNIVFDWINSKPDAGTFRYAIFPYSGTLGLNAFGRNPDLFTPPIASTKETLEYAYFVLNALAQNRTQKIGALLAPAAVKYLIVTSNTEEPDNAKWYVQGDAKVVLGATPFGSPAAFLRLLKSQTDLKLVDSGRNYWIFENLDYFSLVQTFPNSMLVAGDREATGELASVEGYDLQSNMLLFAEQKGFEIPSSLQYASNFFLFNSRILDLAISTIFETYSINLFSRTSSSTDNWTLATPLNNYLINKLGKSVGDYGEGYFPLSDGYIEAHTRATAKLAFDVSPTQVSDIYARVLYSPNSGGRLQVAIDDHNLTQLNTSTDSYFSFKWTFIGQVPLVAGPHSVTLDNLFGYSAVETVAVIPHDALASAETILMSRLSTMGKLVILKTDSPLVTKYNVNTTETVVGASNASNWVPLNSGIDIKPGDETFQGNATVEMSGQALASLHDQIAMAYSPAQSLDLSGADFLQTWIRASTGGVGFAFRGNSTNNFDLMSIYQTNIQPNVWNLVTIPLDKNALSREETGQIQIYQGGGTTGQFESLWVGPMTIGQIRTRHYSFQLELPRTESYELRPTFSGALSGNLTLSVNGSPIELDATTSSLHTLLRSGSNVVDIVVSRQLTLTKVVLLTEPILIRSQQALISMKKLDSTSYDVDVEWKSAGGFLALSKAFDPSWQAFCGSVELHRLIGFSLTNAYHSDTSCKIHIRYNSQDYFAFLGVMELGLVATIGLVFHNQLLSLLTTMSRVRRCIRSRGRILEL